MSDINAENKDKSGYDANKLNVALADIKSGLAKAKESKGNLTEEDVRKIVEDTLKKLQTRSGYNRKPDQYHHQFCFESLKE